MTAEIPMTSASEVAIFHGEPCYSSTPPFSPDDAPPEYPFQDVEPANNPNPAYRAVRGALRLLGLDAERLDTPHWNPLGVVVRPGDTVVVKPNFVRDFRETQSGHADCLITHGSVIRAVLDYVYIALGGSGRIIVADAPHNDADFAVIRQVAGLDEIQTFYQDHATLKVEVYDLRPECAHKIDGVIVGHSSLPGDPAGNVAVNIGLESEFAEVNHLCHLLYGSEYDTDELHGHQHDDVHEYLIAKTVLDADVVISVPKLKTHKKVGLTVNMKNLVGINGNKNWLPHHREGTPAEGGDQFQHGGLKRRTERVILTQFKRLFPLLGPLRPALARPIKAVGKRIFGDTNAGTVRSGNWYGNDTTWRMVIDLNRILHYADSHGRLHDRPVRRFFSIVDALIAGEGNGPLDPDPKPIGLVLAGGNPVAVDLACARIAGFDYERIPVLHRALRGHRWPLVEFSYTGVVGRSNEERFNRALADVHGSAFAFRPHFGWERHVEIETDTASDEKMSSCVA